ncbi:MAG: alpha-galactosidase [Oscillospiraceae bacterium]|nr:alpha-galactosidase [Oscillospiraceae bacterium]
MIRINTVPSKLSYQIQFRENIATVSGTHELADGPNIIVERLPQATLRKVTAVMQFPTVAQEKIFMNGYQTWTYCPELGRQDYTRRMGHFPKPLLNHYKLEQYGDYHFVDYPEQPGISHGESYCYFRQGKRFRLLTSLDEHPGYTLFRYDSKTGTLRIERDCEGLTCCGAFHAFDLFYAEGAEDEVFDAWFAAMGIRPRTGERIAGYSSWYNRYEDITQETIREDLQACIGKLQPGDVFQIDDGWEPFVGDWLEADRVRFPDGMKQAAQEIHDAGFRAGLWLAPFVATKESEVYRLHPDWLLNVDGKPWSCGCNWGGFYSLDLDHPGVQDYLRRVFDRVLNEWGYDLVKLDFLYGVAPFGNERESRAGRMIRGMEFLRELCGDKLILGCGVPLMPAFGLVDYCRVSCDVSLDWDDTLLKRHIHRERVSTRQAIGNSIFRRQLNGRAFLSDPDVFFLRDENLKLSEAQKKKLYTVNALFGGVLFHSDNMSHYRPDQDALYRQIRHMRDATDVRVEADCGLTVRYRLDGQEHALLIE